MPGDDQGTASAAPAGPIKAEALPKPDTSPKSVKRPPADKALGARSGGLPYMTKG